MTVTINSNSVAGTSTVDGTADSAVVLKTTRTIGGVSLMVVQIYFGRAYFKAMQNEK